LKRFDYLYFAIAVEAHKTIKSE